MSFADIHQQIIRLNTNTPDALNSAVEDKLEVIADKFDAFADLLELDAKQVAGVTAQMSDVLLLRDIQTRWDNNEGAAMTQAGATWYLFTPAGDTYGPGQCDLHEVPAQLRYPLGMLQLQPNRTAVIDCGMRIDDINYYVLENNSGQETNEG